MVVLRESPWYNEILREGEVQGEARGEARGKTRGRLDSIGTALTAKFGAPGLELIPQISPISNVDHLDLILRQIILTSSLEEIRQVILDLKEQV
jgi:predicted transposase YdaD